MANLIKGTTIVNYDSRFALTTNFYTLLTYSRKLQSATELIIKMVLRMDEFPS